MSDSHVPIVDVLVPAYNAERTIVEALQSVQRQTLTDIRILVINDGSSDNTSQLVHELARDDPRILVFDQANMGIVATRNRTVDYSSAPFLAMHDADDRSCPDRLERQLRYLQDHPDCVAVSGNSWYIDADGRRIGGRSEYHGTVQPDPDAYPSVEPYLPQPFVMIRRDALLAVNGYREATNAEDTDLYWRLMSVGRLHNMSDILGEYRMHGVSASAAAVKNGRLSAINSQLAALSYKRHRSGMPDIDFTVAAAQALAGLDGIEPMVAFASCQLSASEADYLRVAVAAKLLEMASYRPYMLSAADCRYISDALPNARAGQPLRKRLLIAYQEAHVLRRLFAKGCWAEMRALNASPIIYAGILPALGARHFKALLQSWRRDGALQ